MIINFRFWENYVQNIANRFLIIYIFLIIIPNFMLLFLLNLLIIIDKIDKIDLSEFKLLI